jgi:hypothetical protein
MRARVLVEFQTGKQSTEILSQEDYDVLGFWFCEVSEIPKLLVLSIQFLPMTKEYGPFKIIP